MVAAVETGVETAEGLGNLETGVEVDRGILERLGFCLFFVDSKRTFAASLFSIIRTYPACFFSSFMRQW